LLLSLVRIVRFSFKTHLRNIVVSNVRKTTIASAVGSITINNLLFRERGQWVSIKEVETFNGSNSSESPAGTTLSLVLDRGDSTLWSPIPRVREISIDAGIFNIFQVVNMSANISSVESSEFFSGKISESIQGESGSVFRVSIPSGNELVVFNEGLESMSFSVSIFVFLVVLQLPGGPEIAKVDGRSKSRDQDNSG